MQGNTGFVKTVKTNEQRQYAGTKQQQRKQRESKVWQRSDKREQLK